MIDLTRFNNIEIHPCKIIYMGLDGQCMEQCEPDDPDLAVWAVYGHLKRGGLEWLADCDEINIAMILEKRLLEILPIISHQKKLAKEK